MRLGYKRSTNKEENRMMEKAIRIKVKNIYRRPREKLIKDRINRSLKQKLRANNNKRNSNIHSGSLCFTNFYKKIQQTALKNFK